MASHSSASPVERLFTLIRFERSDIFVLVTYTIIIGLVTLVVPITMQSLVNTIAAGVAVQPIVVLSLLVFAFLIVASVLQMMKFAVIERMQQRVFAQTALRLAHHLSRVCSVSLRGEYAPELVNRFFDVLTVQKALSKLLLDGLAAFIQAVVGLLLLAFSSTSLLWLNIGIIVFVLVSMFLLGWGGIRSSLDESKAKYEVADWLEDIARCHLSLKVHGSRPFLEKRADRLVYNYIRARQKHFRVLVRQLAGHYIFTATANAGLLAAGGFLVIEGELGLGQLVAAQIIVTTVLSSMEKLVRQSEQYFDLVTGLEKVGHVTDLDVEREDGRPLPVRTEWSGANVHMRNVTFTYGSRRILDGLDLDILPGAHVSLVGESGAGKSTLAHLLCALEEPSHGIIEIDGIELRDAELTSLRREVALVGFENELFDGSIEDNVIVGREWISRENLRWAFEVANLSADIASFPDGPSTRVVSGGVNLSRGQVQRLLLARAIVGRPRLLILDEAFTGIDERQTLSILDGIFSPDHPWTIFNISHSAKVIVRTPRVHVLDKGQIVESGTPTELSQSPDSEFSNLFPDLSANLRRPIRGAARIARQRAKAVIR